MHPRDRVKLFLKTLQDFKEWNEKIKKWENQWHSLNRKKVNRSIEKYFSEEDVIEMIRLSRHLYYELHSQRSDVAKSFGLLVHWDIQKYFDLKPDWENEKRRHEPPPANC